MFIPNDNYLKLEKVFKPNSLKTMNTQIKRIFNLGNKYVFNKDYLMDFDNIKNLVSTKLDKTSVKKAMINTIMKVLLIGFDIKKTDDTIIKYEKYFGELVKLHNQNYLYSEAKNELLHYSKIREKFNDYQKKINDNTDIITWRKYVILALYSCLPPLRGEEYYNTYIKTYKKSDLNNYINKNDFNFYDTTSGTLIIKKYKTEKIYGTRILKFPPRLKKIVNQWIKIQKKDKLIDVSQQLFTETLFNIFEPYKISTSALRKIYISNFVKKMDGKKRQELAYKMGHSLQAQEFIYKKKIKK